MAKIITLCLLLLCVQYQEETMSWSHNTPLEWADFRGEPVSGTSVVAVTASGLSFSFSTQRTDNQLSDYSFKVEAHFYPEKSWYVKERATDYTLAHERLHFDITELYARKFRKRVRNTEFTNNIDVEMERIYNQINAELSTMQDLYDEETNHSRNVESQRQWQAKITLEMNKLSMYRS